MKIGILRETKVPEDNRVALIPAQIAELKRMYPAVEFMVQRSATRAYSDEEYVSAGVSVVDSVDDCDLIFGIKEADKSILHPDRHYVFFGHIAKMQRYNIPLFRAFIDKHITFSDYEYMVDASGIRLVAFGWYAGIVGLYYTLLGWGRRTGLYELMMPHKHFTVEDVIRNIKGANIGGLKIVVTGTGRVSSGAQHVLEAVGARRLSCDEFVATGDVDCLTYCVAGVEECVARRDGGAFDFEDFKAHPGEYEQTFDRFARSADVLLSCHFWNSGQPVYLERETFLQPGFRIKMIGDITCDIQGSIKSTLRSSTHSEPFFDYNPATGEEEKAFSRDSNVTVMAVDTCPNALPRETSQYFGEQLIKYVLTDILAGNTDRSAVLDRATILREGALTADFDYLSAYVEEFTSAE